MKRPALCSSLPAALALACLTACGSDSSAPGDSGVGGSVLSPDGGLPGLGDGGSGGNHPGAGSDASQVTDPGTDASVPVIGPVITPGDPGAADVTLEVHGDGQLHAISALIYGTNDSPEIARNHQTVVRLGGNRWTAYNWENNASNAGSDWYFQNDGLISSSNEPAKPVLDAIADAAGHSAATLVTVPIVDYVSADKNGDGDVRNSGQNYLATRFKQNKPEKGSALGAPNTSDGFVYQDEFVAYVKGRAGSARVLFSLDNEPDLWSSTHAEVHPNPLTYAELWDRNQRYASAIKSAWPTAEVTGFVSYGYAGFTSLQNASDAQGRVFLDWYLDQAKAAEGSAGKRLIDYLDLHWYPEASGNGVRITAADADPGIAAAREQAPRSLWDAAYVEDSWIARDVLGGKGINLLPWLKDKIASHYPGTKLAITEWNYGGGGHISGAIATADVLGIFGRDGVDLATYWPLAADESFAYAAFRAYRNYDGEGSSFGDVSVPATTTDAENVSVYASLRADQPERVVIIVINKANQDKSAGLRLSHASRFSTASVFTLRGSEAEVVPAGSVSTTADNAWLVTLPAQSISVLVPEP